MNLNKKKKRKRKKRMRVIFKKDRNQTMSQKLENMNRFCKQEKTNLTIKWWKMLTRSNNKKWYENTFCKMIFHKKNILLQRLKDPKKNLINNITRHQDLEMKMKKFCMTNKISNKKRIKKWCNLKEREKLYISSCLKMKKKLKKMKKSRKTKSKPHSKTMEYMRESTLVLLMDFKIAILCSTAEGSVK